MTETCFDFNDGNGLVKAHKHENGGGCAGSLAMKDYAKIDTSEPLNKYEMFVHGVAFVIVMVTLIYWILM